MILQNIWGRVVGNVMINISPSNIFQKILLKDKYIQNCQACFGLFECFFSAQYNSHGMAYGHHAGNRSKISALMAPIF